MGRVVRIGFFVLVVSVLAGTALRQWDVDRRAQRQRNEQRPFIGYGPSGAMGARGFWAGLAETDSLSCGREIAALESLRVVLPEYAPGEKALALAYAYAGSSEQAVAAAERYTSLCPGDAEARLFSALVHLLAGRYDAVDVRLRERLPDSLRYWTEAIRAGALAGRGRYEDAVAALERSETAAAWDRLRSDARFEIGRMRLLQGRTADARRAFLASALDGTDDARVGWGVGRVDLAEGNVARARAQADALADLEGGASGLRSGWAGHLEGAVLLAEGRAAEAVAVLARASREARAPDRVEILTALANACLAAGRAPEARRAVDRALRINPSSVPARVLSARLYEAAGDLSNAAADLERALDVWIDADPGLALRLDAERRLGRLTSAGPP